MMCGWTNFEEFVHGGGSCYHLPYHHHYHPPSLSNFMPAAKGITGSNGWHKRIMMEYEQWDTKMVQTTIMRIEEHSKKMNEILTT